MFTRTPKLTKITRQASIPPHQGLSNSVISHQEGQFSGCNSETVRLEITRISTEETDLYLSAAEAMNFGSGFIRGMSGDPQYIRANGEIVTDPREMRCDCLSLQEHLERIYQTTSSEITAAVSFGNLMTNEEYVAYVRGPQDSALFCRQRERARLTRGYLYHALGVKVDGSPWAGCVSFTQKGTTARVVGEDGKDLTEQLHTVFTGPPLTWNGKVLHPEHTAHRWAADLRHALTLPVCPLHNGRKTLLGEAILMHDIARLRSAVRGEPIVVPLTWPGADGPAPLPQACVEGLVANARACGYTLMPDVGVRERGQFALKNRQIIIRYREGLYPHHILGLDDSQTFWIDVQVGGVSTKSGCTLGEAASIMLELGAVFSIGLDQGADPQLFYKLNTGDHHFYFKPSFIFRSRVSAALVWTSKTAQKPAKAIRKAA